MDDKDEVSSSKLVHFFLSISRLINKKMRLCRHAKKVKQQNVHKNELDQANLSSFLRDI